MRSIFILSFSLFVVTIGGLQAQKIVVQYLEVSSLNPVPFKLLKEFGGNQFGDNALLKKSTLSIYPTYSEFHTDSIFYWMETSYPFKHSLPPRYVYKTYSDQLIYSHDVLLDNQHEAFQNTLNESLQWEIDPNKQKKILGLNCVQARARIDNQYSSGCLEAWFTEDIPFPDGPEYSFCFTFPGLILELRIPMVETTFIAESIDFCKPEQGELAAPKFTRIKDDPAYITQYYLGLDKGSKYILSDETPQNIWLPYPKM